MLGRIYLVTGAAVFLGGTICRQIVERGEQVRAFVLPNDKAIKYVLGEKIAKTTDFYTLDFKRS